MDYYLQQEYNDSNESDSDNNHLEGSTVILAAIIFSIDFHQISKTRRNIYTFIHIHTNTSD